MKALLLACLALPGAAAAFDYPDLPAAALVEKALRAHPAVVAARAGIEVGEARRDELAAGPHEFALRLGSRQRREVDADRRLQEKELGLERALRLPGKAAKDAEIGAATLAAAHSAYGDALHEAARLLLANWFEWRRARAATEEWRRQAALLGQQADVVAKRIAAGDAPRVEALLTTAQQTQAEAQLAQAESRAQLAASALRQHFPALPLPAQVGAATPAPIEGPLEAWQERALEHSHELASARLDTQLQQLRARRLDAERVPDPTLGVAWASERSGQERVLGLALSMPLPGAARAAQARAALAETGVAAAREAEVRARVDAEAQRSFERAGAAYAQWRRLTDVAARIDENAALLEKAWRLGEGQIGDLLAVRRQQVEARLAAAQAQLDAAETRYRLLLDTHRLWAFDGTASSPHDD